MPLPPDKSRREFLRLLARTEANVERLTQAASGNVSQLLLHASGNKEFVDWTVIRPFKIELHSELNRWHILTSGEIDEAIGKVIDLAHESALEQIAAQNAASLKMSKAELQSVLDKAEFSARHDLSRTLMEQGSGGQPLSEVLSDAARDTFSRVSRILSVGATQQASIASMTRAVMNALSPAPESSLKGKTLKQALGVPSNGRGVYKSLAANAKRIVVTELANADTTARQEWAKENEQITGGKLVCHLSASHPKDDECDDHDGEVVDADDEESLPPFHPHCLCWTSPYFDPERVKALAKKNAALV